MATVGRVLEYKLEIDWDFSGTFIDETQYLVRAEGDYRVNAPGSSILSPRGIVPQMKITLLNDGRFSPFNSPTVAAGGLKEYIEGGKAYHAKVMFSVKVDAGSFIRVFTGYLKTPTDAAITSNSVPTVTFDCRGVEELIQQKRKSSGLNYFAARYNDGSTESDIITAWLTAAGLTPSAGDIDPGLFIIPFSWMDDESPIDDIWQIASACGGWAYSTRDGDMVFRNAYYLASGAAASESFSKSDYESLSLRYDDKELFSEVIVEASPRAVAPETVLWEPDDIPIIPANDVVTITAKLRQPAYSISSLSYDAITFGGVDIGSDISVTQTQYAQRIELEITNSNATYAASLRNLQIIGIPVVGAPTTEVRKVSTIADGATAAQEAYWSSSYNRSERSRTLRGNVYIQTRQQAAMLATMLRDWHSTPRVYVEISGTIGEPSRDLLDRVTVSNDDILSSDLDIFITGIKWTAGSSGYRQSIEGIAADGFYPWSDDAEGYFVIGTNKLGASGTSGAAHLFY